MNLKEISFKHIYLREISTPGADHHKVAETFLSVSGVTEKTALWQVFSFWRTECAAAIPTKLQPPSARYADQALAVHAPPVRSWSGAANLPTDLLGGDSPPAGAPARFW